MKVVEQDREELEIKHRNVSKELEATRQRTKKLRDQATKKLTNQEQKEILNLLLKNFEFEMKNIEMQANLFKRDFKIREQDMIILRLEQHRSLCDTLIHQQRQLIVENNVNIPHDLDELFTLYSRDVNEGQLISDINGIRSASNSSFINLSPKSSNTLFLTQIEEEKHDLLSITPTNTYNNKNNNRNQIPKNNFNSNQSRIKKENDYSQKNKNGNRKTSKESNVSYFTNGNSLGPITMGQQLAFNSKKNLSNISNSTNESNNMEILFENSTEKQSIRTSPNSKITRPFELPGHIESPSFPSNEDAKRLTQGIAAKAAQRKAFQHHRELMQELGQQENNDYAYNPILSNNLTPSRLAKHDQIYGISDDIFNEKKNSFLTDTTNKTKKQVKIKDIVEFKLPDDEKSNNKNLIRRNSFDSYRKINIFRKKNMLKIFF